MYWGIIASRTLTSFKFGIAPIQENAPLWTKLGQTLLPPVKNFPANTMIAIVMEKDVQYSSCIPKSYLYGLVRPLCLYSTIPVLTGHVLSNQVVFSSLAALHTNDEFPPSVERIQWFTLNESVLDKSCVLTSLDLLPIPSFPTDPRLLSFIAHKPRRCDVLDLKENACDDSTESGQSDCSAFAVWLLKAGLNNSDGRFRSSDALMNWSTTHTMNRTNARKMTLCKPGTCVLLFSDFSDNYHVVVILNEKWCISKFGSGDIGIHITTPSQVLKSYNMDNVLWKFSKDIVVDL
jgi:hypothetical protein